MPDHIKHTVTSEQMALQCHRDTIAMMKDHGYCVVEIKAGSRSLSQNALYWEWITCITDFINQKNKTDFKIDEIHMRMKHDFLGYTSETKIGSSTIPPQLKSTTKLTKGEMFHYMLQIEAYWVGLGLLLPRPEDSVYAFLRHKNETG